MTTLYDMEFSDLLVILGGFQNVFNFCVSQKLLANCQQCSRCGSNRDLKQQTFVSHGRQPEVTLGILFHTAHGITFVSGSADPRTACFRFSPERPPFKTSR